MPELGFNSDNLFKGLKGTLKTLFIKLLGKLVGKWQFVQTSNAADLTGQMTDKQGVYLLYLDETFAADCHLAHAYLKAVVTKKRVRIRSLYRDTEDVQNTLKLIGSSNQFPRGECP